VYAPQEKRMTPLSIELILPQGITLEKPLRYPKPDRNHDPFLEVDVYQYEQDVPISALNLKASESLPEGDCVVKISVSYQACNAVLCYPPTTKTFEIPINVVPKETKRNQVSGWKTW
jgi:thiol:disulfide interchange protein